MTGPESAEEGGGRSRGGGGVCGEVGGGLPSILYCMFMTISLGDNWHQQRYVMNK